MSDVTEDMLELLEHQHDDIVLLQACYSDLKDAVEELKGAPPGSFASQAAYLIDRYITKARIFGALGVIAVVWTFFQGMAQGQVPVVPGV